MAYRVVPGEVLLPYQVYMASLAERQSETEARAEAQHTAEFMNAFDRGGDAEKAVDIMLGGCPGQECTNPAATGGRGSSICHALVSVLCDIRSLSHPS